MVDHVHTTLSGDAFLDEIISSSESKNEAVAKLMKKIDSMALDFVNSVELLEEIPDNIEDVRTELVQIYADKWVTVYTSKVGFRLQTS